jgi:hypothetical protein
MGCGGSKSADLEAFAANLTKQQRLFERDIKRLALEPHEVSRLFAAFAEADGDGSGALTEAKWVAFMRHSTREKLLEDKRAAADRDARDAKDRAEREKLQAELTAAEKGKDAPRAKKARDALAKRKEAEAVEQRAEAARLEAERGRERLARTKYARRLFACFARSGRGQCDFGEFLCRQVRKHATPARPPARR